VLAPAPDPELAVLLDVPEPPPDPDELELAPAPADAAPAGGPYPLVFGPVTTLQKVAVISSMQITSVAGFCGAAEVAAGFCAAVAVDSWFWAAGSDIPLVETCAAAAEGHSSTKARNATHRMFRLAVRCPPASP
jgi:hypothetical protein